MMSNNLAGPLESRYNIPDVNAQEDNHQLDYQRQVRYGVRAAHVQDWALHLRDLSATLPSKKC